MNGLGMFGEWRPTVRIRLVAQDVPAEQGTLFELGSGAVQTCDHLGTGRERQAPLLGGADDVICSRCGNVV